MNKATSNYRADLIQTLRDNEEEQILYLQASLEDEEYCSESFLLALKTIAEARGFKKFAAEAGLSRESLYRTLSENGNPKLETIIKLLSVLGMRLSVEPFKKSV